MGVESMGLAGHERGGKRGGKEYYENGGDAH
jgi:hypothetical protein